jgi:hypothetical protein
LVSDVGRLLPDGFAQAYWDAFGDVPPEEFLEAYEVACDVLYYGTRIRDEKSQRVTGGDAYQYFFGDPSLLSFKGAIDNRLAAIRAALRTWTEARSGSRAGGSGPAPDRRGDLADGRGAGDHRPQRDDEKE